MTADVRSFCAVPTPTIVYASPSTREEFDRLSLPMNVHAWTPCEMTTLIKADGHQWERQCHSKSLGSFAPDEVTVIFQWFDYRVATEVSI
jgi:hypothetical protein